MDKLDAALRFSQQALAMRAYRQEVISSNIANADTPGYKTKDIDFESELGNALVEAPTAREVSGLVNKNDGNNVSLDREARLLAENALRFNVTSNLLHSKIKMMRMAIENGSSSST